MLVSFRQGYMAVIRATDGSLLLFNPVKITPKVQEQVEAMGGRVRWIVSGSAYHTLFMRSAVGAFPDAKVVASTGAAYKLAKVTPCPRGSGRRRACP